jgi:hypothetical protein
VTAPAPAPKPAPQPSPAKPAAPARWLPPVTSLTHAAPAPGPPPAVAAAAVPGGALALGQQATILVNGKAEDVRVGAVFPKATPFFRLVKIEGGHAEIAPADGAWADGSQTATLVAGTSLTLTNTADGTQFELRLAAIG